VYSKDVSNGLERVCHNWVEPAWVAGAAAGLAIVGERAPSWLWTPFIEDVHVMIEMLNGIEPADPGEIPEDSDGSIASAYESLGGYVSLTGVVRAEGLFFRLLVDSIEEVQTLLQGMGLPEKGGLLIPKDDLDTFLMLVHLDGPIAEEITELMQQ
jgi:hypothetical protein